MDSLTDHISVRIIGHIVLVVVSDHNQAPYIIHDNAKAVLYRRSSSFSIVVSSRLRNHVERSQAYTQATTKQSEITNLAVLTATGFSLGGIP